MKLEDYLQTNYGYNPNIKNDIRTYINQWKSWYQGNVRGFHNYYIYNGKNKVNQKRFTMNMAKEIKSLTDGKGAVRIAKALIGEL